MAQRPERVINKCIYCRAEPGPDELTDEHSLPKGLGGKRILRKASCKRCQKITSANELNVLRTMWQVGRRSLGYGGKNKNDKDTINVRTVSGDVPIGMKDAIVKSSKHPVPDPSPPFSAIQFYEDERIEFDEAPFSIVTYVTGTRPSRLGFNDPPIDQLYWIELRDLKERADKARGERPALGYQTTINTACISQLIAKIAHCYAVDEFGLEKLTPFLADYIAEEEPGYRHELITSRIDDSPCEEDHQVVVRACDTTSGEFLCVVAVRLFARLGGPRFFVVVGALDECIRPTAKRIAMPDDYSSGMGAAGPFRATSVCVTWGQKG